MFNLIGVALMVGFLPVIARGLEKLLPDTKADRERQQRQEKQRGFTDKSEEGLAPQAVPLGEAAG